MKHPRAIDLFCGAGGSSWGARNAGAEIVAGFDMCHVTGAVYRDNFNHSTFYPGKLEEHDPDKIARELGKIDLILASPECTNHSPAKGGKPRCATSKNTAFQVGRYARAHTPRWIVVENVVNMRKWERYYEFLNELHDLGYRTHQEVLCATDFGVPQARRRLFILCDREKKPSPIRKPGGASQTAASIINTNGAYTYTPLYTERRAKATLERAARAMDALGDKEPFLVVYYGSDHAGGWQRLDKPLRTITTLDRFAYVRPNAKGHQMRMLQPEELKKAMSMPENFKLEHGTRRDKIKMIGNAVCPNVMETVVKQLVSSD